MDQQTSLGIERVELPAGDDQLIVLYNVPDYSSEIIPGLIFGEIAEDARRRSVDGWRIVSTSSMPTRHGGVMFGQNGSGFQTKATVIVVYELRGSA